MKADPAPYRLPFGTFVFLCPFCLQPVDCISPAAPFPYLPSATSEPQQFDIRLRMHQRCADSFGPEKARIVVHEARRQMVWECRSLLN